VLDELMDRYDNALEQFDTYGDVDTLNLVAEEFDQGIGFDEYLDRRISAYKLYLVDNASGINRIPKWWDFTRGREGLETYGWFQSTQSMRRDVLRIIDTLSADDQVKRYAKALFMVGANRSREYLFISESEADDDDYADAREWFGTTYFKIRAVELGYRLDEIRDEYLDRISHQEKYNGIPNYIKDRIFTDPRIPLLGEYIPQGGLRQSLLETYGIPYEVFYMIFMRLRPVAKGDREMLFLAMLFRNWMIQKGDENAREYDLIDSSGRKKMMFLWKEEYLPEESFMEIFPLNVTVLSPEKVAEVFNEAMRCVTLVREIMEDIPSDIRRKQVWETAIRVDVPGQIGGYRMNPKKCLERAKNIITNTLLKLKRETTIMSQVDAFLDFIFAERLYEGEMPLREEALSEERLAEVNDMFRRQGKDLFRPHKVKRSSGGVGAMPYIRADLWEEFWDFWIPTIRAVFPTKGGTRLVFYANMKEGIKLSGLAHHDLMETEDMIYRILHPEEDQGKRKRSPLGDITGDISANPAEKEGEDEEYW
jgi:hypothetical protein